MSGKAKILLALALFAALAAAGLRIFRPRTGAEPVIVRIEKGAPLSRIARALHQQGAVRSPALFRLLGLAMGAKDFKYGTYRLRPGRELEAIRKLKSGDTYKIKVTFPEGWSAYQVAERLRQEGVLGDTGGFMRAVETQALEGKLFPETYFFEPGTDPGSLTEAMLARLRENFPRDFQERARALGLTQDQVLTLASIIEREAQIGAERARIASVYHNRLKRGMLLEADPTVQYALGRGRAWKERLTYKDLKAESPYNTYRVRGLPPGPIANPGAESIRAALYPESTPFLFFVADGKGGHVFSRTHAEHLAVQRRIKRESQRP